MPYSPDNPKLAKSREKQNAQRRDKTLQKQAAAAHPTLVKKLAQSYKERRVLLESSCRTQQEQKRIIDIQTGYLNRTVATLNKERRQRSDEVWQAREDAKEENLVNLDNSQNSLSQIVCCFVYKRASQTLASILCEDRIRSTFPGFLCFDHSHKLVSDHSWIKGTTAINSLPILMHQRGEPQTYHGVGARVEGLSKEDRTAPARREGAEA